MNRALSEAIHVNHRNEPTRSQRAADAERFGELLDAGNFPEFVDELIARWREFNAICQRFLSTESELVAFTCELEIFGTPRFQSVALPNGKAAQLFLRDASSELEIRRNPSIVLGLPRSFRLHGDRA
jgi:hypothetical protein